MNGRSTSRVVMMVFGVLSALSIAGLITTAVVGSTADKYGSYGQLPIPGFGVVHLPAGEAIVSFAVYGYGGNGLRVPKLSFDITPPPGVPDPPVTEDLGATVSVNDEAHRRVWFMSVPVEGDYQVLTRGEVGGYVEPRLAFGRTRSLDAPLWVFTALAVVTTDLAIAAWWFGRRRDAAPPAAATDAYLPGDEGVRLEQLKTIAELRDSGALTQREFEAEKRRILGGG